MQYSSDNLPTTDELVALYGSVGWSLYTNDPDALARAVANSTFVVTARDDNGRLVGLCRALSDDESIVYVQDLLVVPDLQRQRIGHSLLRLCLERYAHVRQRVLLTDDEPHQHRLYKQFGFHDVSRLEGADLHAFVDIQGANLTSD